MYKPDKNGLIRVEGAEAIAKAHASPDLVEVGGNSMQGWAEFRVKNPSLFEPKPTEKPKKKPKKEAKRDD